MNIAAVMLAAGLLDGLFGGTRVTQTATQHLVVGPAAHVSVMTINGSVTLSRGPAGMVTVTSTKRAPSGSIDKISVQIEKRGNDVVVGVKMPHSCWFDCGSVSFTVTVPSDASANLETTNGNISEQGIAGVVTASTTNGNISAADLRADSTLSTTNGSIQAFYASTAQAKKAELSTTNGRVNVTLPTGAAIRQLNAETTNGAVHTNFNVSGGRSLHITLAPAGIDLDASTTNGSIEIDRI